MDREELPCIFVSVILCVSSLATVVSLSLSLLFLRYVCVSLQTACVGYGCLYLDRPCSRSSRGALLLIRVWRTMCGARYQKTSLRWSVSCSSRHGSEWLDQAGPPKHHRTEELTSLQRPLAAEEKHALDKYNRENSILHPPGFLTSCFTTHIIKCSHMCLCYNNKRRQSNFL